MQVENGLITLTEGVSVTFAQVGVGMVLAVVIGILGEEIAKYKGRSRVAWLALCSFFPPLILVLLGLEPRPRAR